MQFSLDLLNLPGAQNVPVGSITVTANSVPCDSAGLQDLALLADYDYLEPTARSPADWGDIMFKKLFYWSSVCKTGSGRELRLPELARKQLMVTTNKAGATEIFWRQELP